MSGVKNILVPVDFSHVAKKVVDRASMLAKLYGAKIWLIHVEAEEPYHEDDVLNPLSVSDSVDRDINRSFSILKRFADEIQSADVDVTPLLVHGPIVEKILDEIKKRNADMVVMGSHGDNSLRELLVGSVCAGVLRGGRCPTLIIPSN